MGEFLLVLAAVGIPTVLVVRSVGRRALARRKQHELEEARWEPDVIVSTSGSTIVRVKRGAEVMVVGVVSSHDPDFTNKLFEIEARAEERASALNMTIRR